MRDVRSFGLPGSIIVSLFKFCAVVLFALTCGCATVPYHPTSAADYPGVYPRAKDKPDVAAGRPNRFLDASDWFWPGSLLSKLLLWNGKVDSHQISDETVETLIQFCREHELGDTKIRVNAYAVGEEWRRHRAHRRANSRSASSGRGAGPLD